MTTKLIPLTDLEPAAYNPRKADKQRLEFLKLSLRKLGFVLPLYALENGHLLSGHQRSTAAEALGCTHVPVYVADIANERARNINLIFNRATNDMPRDQTSDSLWGKASLQRIGDLADQLPDLDPETPAFYRALTPVRVPLSDLTPQVTAAYDDYAMEMCSKLLHFGIEMPIVMTTSGRIVNGQFRVMAAGDRSRVHKGKGAKDYPVVYISDEEGEFSESLLNLISMKFTLEDQYADQLRYGAYRRNHNVVEGLLPAYRMLVDGKNSKDGIKVQAEHQTMRLSNHFWRQFRAVYGESVVDLGAGQRRTRPILTEKGVHCIDWEPYPIDWREEIDTTSDKTKPSLPLSRKVSADFLADVASGRSYSTVALPAVLNSVPFRIDRMCVLSLAHALCGFSTQLVGSCRALDGENGLQDRPFLRSRENGVIGSAFAMFPLDYEPGVVIGDVSVMPKIQKMHTEAELRADLSTFFAKVTIKQQGKAMYYVCKAPRRVNLSVLKTALLHEFELPYEGGETIGMGQEALAAFGQRLGVDFSAIEAAPKPKTSGDDE